LGIDYLLLLIVLSTSVATLGDHDQGDQQFPSRPPKKLLFGQAVKSFVPRCVPFSPE
jgi:hypothetical protein